MLACVRAVLSAATAFPVFSPMKWQNWPEFGSAQRKLQPRPISAGWLYVIRVWISTSSHIISLRSSLGTLCDLHWRRFCGISFLCTGASTNMPHARLARLRNAPEIQTGAIRNDKLEFDAFLVKWRNGLNDRGMEWEGRLAVAELKRNDAFEFLLGDGKWAHNRQTQHLFRKMFHEIKVYREEAQGRPTKQHIDEVENKLIAIAEKIQKEMDHESIPNLKRVYERVLVNIRGQRGRLHAIRILTPKKFGFWVEMIWRDLPSRNMVARTIELDTRLQVELGKVLIFYLREKKVSLLTIARLILLAYWAGDLSGLGEIPVKVSKKKGKKEEEEEGSEVNEVPQEVPSKRGERKKEQLHQRLP